MKLKILFCALLAALAMLCLTATLADIGVLDVSAAGDDARYMLKSREGCVCIYRLPDDDTPVLVSSLQTRSLSAGEKAALALGVTAEDYAAALEKLEALGA